MAIQAAKMLVMSMRWWRMREEREGGGLGSVGFEDGAEASSWEGDGDGEGFGFEEDRWASLASSAGSPAV